MTRIVVCDTGPLLHLSEADALFMLQMVGEVLIPLRVADEFEKNAPGKTLPEWVQLVELDEMFRQKSEEWKSVRYIDAGGSAAIALSLQMRADWLLSDDAKARQFAETLGLEVHGTIGLLLWNVAVGYVTKRDIAINLLNTLAGTSLWISDRVLRQARQAIDDLLFD